MKISKEEDKSEVEITKEKVILYEKCRASGVTNMFDVKTVGMITDLSKEELIEIMKNYKKYMEKFNVERE